MEEILNDANVVVEETVNPQAEADKIAIDASGGHHLNNIFKSEVAQSLGKIAGAVVQILASSNRSSNWTYEEVLDIWNKVKKGD